jgi:hypothetical protein
MNPNYRARVNIAKIIQPRRNPEGGEERRYEVDKKKVGDRRGEDNEYLIYLRSDTLISLLHRDTSISYGKTKTYLA